MNNKLLVTYAIVVGAFIVLWFAMRLLTRGKFHFPDVYTGVDGRLSTSKFQATLWTICVIAGYIAIYVARSLNGEFPIRIDIPMNLLLLTGTSVGTFVGAAVITQAGIKSGSVDKTPATSATAGNLVDDDGGRTDLGKFQLVAWTLIANSIFLFTIHQSLITFFSSTSAPPTTLHFPDIDPSLLAFTGISQATYLVKKATGTENPAPSLVSPVTTPTPGLPQGGVAPAALKEDSTAATEPVRISPTG